MEKCDKQDKTYPIPIQNNEVFHDFNPVFVLTNRKQNCALVFFFNGIFVYHAQLDPDSY